MIIIFNFICGDVYQPVKLFIICDYSITLPINYKLMITLK